MPWPSPRVAAPLAMAGAILLLLVAPFHAAAYFNTVDGDDLFPWQESGGRAMRDGMPGMFDFSDSYQVYRTYGIGSATALSLMAVGFLGFQGVQETRLAGWRRNVGRVACGGWVMLGVVALLGFTTGLDEVLFPFALLSLLTLIVCTAVAGFAGARTGAAPRRMARALAIAAALYIPLIVLLGHVPLAASGFAVVWLAFGPSFRRMPEAPPTSPKAGRAASGR